MSRIMFTVNVALWSHQYPFKLPVYASFELFANITAPRALAEIPNLTVHKSYTTYNPK